MDIFDQSVIWDSIIEHGIATEEELQLVTDVAGYSVEVLNSVVYSRTGYNNIEQFEGE